VLYWAEGTKARNSVEFANSASEMVAVFARFLRKYFGGVELKAKVFCYDGNGLSHQDVETFWGDVVGGPVKVRMKAATQTGRGSKVNKRPYGCCNLYVHNTEIVHQIYGAIQELAGIERPEWLY